MKIRNLILLAFGLFPFWATSQNATFDRVRLRQGLTIRAEKADSIIRAVTALSNHTSIPTAKAVWDAIAAIVAASKYQTLRDDGSNMTQQPAANFVSTGTVSFTLTNDPGNLETEVAAAVPTGGITTTEILDGTIINADISSSANIANSKLANSGVTASSYPSTGGSTVQFAVNSKGIITSATTIPLDDPSATNEGTMGVGAGSGSTSVITSNTSGANGVTIAAGTGIGISETTSSNGGTITISNTAPENGPDSTWAKSPSGAYMGKRITDNVYRTGKSSVGTTDTTAMLNLRPRNPVGSGLTWVSSIQPPARSAYTGGTWTNGSVLNIETIDPNPMKPNHYPSFLYGTWTDVISVDSATNLAAGKPGNLIRNRGWNQDGENPSLAKWKWSNEQHYVPPGSTLAEWEEHIEIVDTLGRTARPVNYRGRHNGDIYGVGFQANDWYVSKPHNSGYLLRIRGDGSNTGKWSTDYPYTFQINNATRIGRLMERLHGGSYRNVLDWTTNGRLDVGDSSGVSVQNRLQITRANADQPEIISPDGYVVFDSTQIRVNSTDANNRHIVIQRPGTSHTWGLNYSSTNFSFEADYARTPFSIARTAPTTAFTMNSTGRVGLGISDAYSLIHAQQPANDLTGGLILAPTTGNYFGLFVNGNNEVAFNRGGTDRMFLTDGGQIKLPAYTSSSSFPITAAGVLGFNSAGQIGTVAGITGTGSGTAGQIAVFDGSSSVTGYTSFTRSGSNILVGASGSDHVEIIPGTSEISFFDAGNVDARIKANGSVLETNVGVSIVGNSTVTGTLDVSGAISTGGHFRAPGISSGNSGIGTTATGTFNAFAPNGTSPYITFSEAGVANRGAFGFPASSGDFVWTFGNQVLSSGTERMRMTSAGRLGVGASSPGAGFHLRGTGVGSQIFLDNTTATTGENWYISSLDGGNLVLGNPTSADALTINGTTGAVSVANTLTVGSATGTAASIAGLTSGGVVTTATIGSGLSLSGGTLSATGGATDLGFSGASSPVTLTSSTGADVTITAGGINSLSATGTNLTITATEAQTFSNTSDPTSHTVTITNTGGSVQFVEGSGITLTTTGTSGAGVVTIAASGGGGGSPSVETLTEWSADQDNVSINSATTTLRVSGDNGIRGLTSINASGMTSGREFNILNVGTHPVVIQAQHPDGSSANKFDILQDVVLAPKSGCRAIYDGTSTAFRVIADAAQTQKRFGRNVVAGSVTAGDWGEIDLVTSGGTITDFAASAAIPSAFALNTSTSATGKSYILGAKTVNALFRSGYGYLYFRAVVTIPTLSTTAQRFLSYNGLLTSANSPNDGGYINEVSFVYSHDINSGKWEGWSSSGADIGTVDLGVTVAAGTPYTLEIYLNKQRTEARYYIDGVYRGRRTTVLPDDGTIMRPTCAVHKTAGTTSRSVYVHELEHWGVMSN